MNWFKNYFEFDKHKTSFKQESIGGLTTFLAISYILILNPMILAETGMPADAVFVATGLQIIIGTLLMAFVAKYPLAVGPGMGLNAFFAYGICLGMGIPWEVALTAVFISSAFFAVLTLSGFRAKIINAIPNEMKIAIAAGIGLFITFIGLKNAGMIVANPDTFVALGDFSDPNVRLAMFGLIVTIIMVVKKIHGAVFYGMAITTITGIFLGLIQVPTEIIAPIPSIAPTFGAALEPIFTDFAALITSKEFLIAVFTLLFVDFFDCAGAVIAVTTQGGFTDKDGNLPRAGRTLFCDSAAGMSGAVLGSSTPTVFLESSAGIAAGARTGFSSIVVAGLVLLALFFSPLLAIVTPAVTAPALIIVGCLMAQNLGAISWNKIEIAIPAFITIIAMPLTFGIAHGIELGFFFYPITMTAAGRAKEVSPIMWFFGILFGFTLFVF